MCLAVPMQIVEINGNLAKVELAGNTYQADLTLVEGAEVGDWILAHAGFAIERLDPAEAEETLDMFAEMEESTRGATPDS